MLNTWSTEGWKHNSTHNCYHQGRWQIWQAVLSSHRFLFAEVDKPAIKTCLAHRANTNTYCVLQTNSYTPHRSITYNTFLRTLTLYDSIRCWVITVTFSITVLNLVCVAWEIKVTTSAGTSVIPSFLAKAKKTKQDRISLPPTKIQLSKEHSQNFIFLNRKIHDSVFMWQQWSIHDPLKRAVTTLQSLKKKSELFFLSLRKRLRTLPKFILAYQNKT